MVPAPLACRKRKAGRCGAPGWSTEPPDYLPIAGNACTGYTIIASPTFERKRFPSFFRFPRDGVARRKGGDPANAAHYRPPFESDTRQTQSPRRASIQAVNRRETRAQARDRRL